MSTVDVVAERRHSEGIGDEDDDEEEERENQDNTQWATMMLRSHEYYWHTVKSL